MITIEELRDLVEKAVLAAGEWGEYSNHASEIYYNENDDNKRLDYMIEEKNRFTPSLVYLISIEPFYIEDLSEEKISDIINDCLLELYYKLKEDCYL